MSTCTPDPAASSASVEELPRDGLIYVGLAAVGTDAGRHPFEHERHRAAFQGHGGSARSGVTSLADDTRYGFFLRLKSSSQRAGPFGFAQKEDAAALRVSE